MLARPRRQGLRFSFTVSYQTLQAVLVVNRFDERNLQRDRPGESSAPADDDFEGRSLLNGFVVFESISRQRSLGLSQGISQASGRAIQC